MGSSDGAPQETERVAGTVHHLTRSLLNRSAWVCTGVNCNEEDHSMRKKLVVSTAALLAGIAMASAQEMPSGKQSGGGAQMERGSAGQDHGGQGQRGAQDQSKQGQSQQRSQRQENRDRTTGQAQQGQADQSKQGQRDQSKQGQRDQSMQGQSKQGQRDQGMQGQGKQGQAQRSQGQSQRDQTSGQAQRDQSRSSTHSQRGQPDQTQGQAPQPQQSQQTSPQRPQSQTQQGQTSQQGQAQQGQDKQGQFQSQAGGSVTLSSQQRTRIRQTVLAGSNVPRVNNVNFSLSVGTAVPSSVRVVDVSPALIEINPQWRGHQYFVAHDDVVIVDRSHKIVAVVPTGSSGGAQLHNNNRSAALSTLNLTEEQIREVQIALKQKGFNIGRTDGRLGPRTTEALIAFQRQQGFEANGRPDSQTVTALGLSNMTGAQGGAQGAGQSSTTGQVPAGHTSGQGGTSQQQAPAQQNEGPNQPQQNEGANQPSTTGQGSATQHQAPAQPTQPPANQSQHDSGSK
jgi:hypothetical protein